MFQRHARIKIALAALLAGALALPGLAAARGDRDWGDRDRGDWHQERGRYDREGRDWDPRRPRRDDWHGHRHHPHPVAIERPVYRRYDAPPPPPPPPGPRWADDGISVIRPLGW
jgi:hypothetical protein